MHDPMTVAFRIRYPWPWPRHGDMKLWDGKPPRDSFITIWHVDPELDGSDDSCGWFRPRLTKKQKEKMESLAWWEAREPWFQRSVGKQLENPVVAENLTRAALMCVAYVLGVKLSVAKATELAIDLVHNHADNIRSMLCFLPGWHENTEQDTPESRKWHSERFYYCLAGVVLRHKRKWYQHPRWHIWHWKLQVHPLQLFKRWAFSRCSKCGRGFKYGEYVVSGNWNGTGPRWFRSEENVYHDHCGTSNASVPVNTIGQADDGMNAK